jgi:hypothetical protein
MDRTQTTQRIRITFLKDLWDNPGKDDSPTLLEDIKNRGKSQQEIKKKIGKKKDTFCHWPV